jgi:hypothetical protein
MKSLRTDPIIITGAGHSGTRGLVQVLARAGNVYLGDISHPKKEWEFYRQLATRVNGRLLDLPEVHDHNIIPPDVYNQLRISPAQVADLRDYILQEIAAWPEESLPPDGADLWVIKTPRMTLCLEVWHEVFPDARFINLLRDGRDVAASLPASAGSLLRRFDLWRGRVNRMRHYQEAGLPIIDFRYEDLPDETKVKALCVALGITYSPSMQKQLIMSLGKGRVLRGLPYERVELMRYGYPVRPSGLRDAVQGWVARRWMSLSRRWVALVRRRGTGVTR